MQKETIPLASNDNFIFSPDVINDKEDRSRGRMAIKENNLDNMAVENDERKMPDTINYTFKMPADTQSGGVTLAYDYRKNNVDVNSEAPVGEKLELEVTKSKNEDIAMVETKALKKDKLEKRKQTVSANPAPMNNSNVSNSDLLINKNSSDSINFGMANINFNKNNLDKCLEFLKTIIANSASMYYEDGLFLKAKVLVKQNKIKEAKAVLNTVILLNGIRKTEAEVLLKGLK